MANRLSPFNPIGILYVSIGGVDKPVICVSKSVLKQWAPTYTIAVALQVCFPPYLPRDDMAVITLKDYRDIRESILRHYPAHQISTVVKHGMLLEINVN
jgi:hypothetical protein